MEQSRIPLGTADGHADNGTVGNDVGKEKVALPTTDILYRRALERSAQIKAGHDQDSADAGQQ